MLAAARPSENQTMQFSGDLAQWKMADLLSAVADSEQSGKLRLSRREGEAIVLFEGGRINYAATRAGRETFGSILIAQRKITPGQLQTALEVQRTLGNKSLGAILVDLSVLSPEAVRDAVAQQITQVLADLMTWDHGHYEFRPMSISWGGYTSLPLSRVLPPDVPTTGPAADELADRLQEEPPLRPVPATAPAPVVSHLDLLKQISLEIRSPEITGELVTRVLATAREVVDRAVLFLVRPDGYQGIGQAGLRQGRADANQEVRRLFISSNLPSILREATDQRAAIRRPLSTSDGDAELAVALNASRAVESVAAPITTSGRVLSILYGDNLVSGNPLGSTTALETELDKSGLEMEEELLTKRQSHFDALRDSIEDPPA